MSAISFFNIDGRGSLITIISIVEAMNRKQMGIAIAALVAGAAIGGSLFYLFPNTMFKGTGFEQQAGLPTGGLPQSLGDSGGNAAAAIGDTSSGSNGIGG